MLNDTFSVIFKHHVLSAKKIDGSWLYISGVGKKKIFLVRKKRRWRPYSLGGLEDTAEINYLENTEL